MNGKLWTLILAAGALCACDRLNLGASGHAPDGPDGAPTPDELGRIGYMTAENSGPKGRRTYTHLEQARSCADLALAVRWNRPPNIESGPFHQKMVYLAGAVSADLAPKSEVFISGRIERWATLSSGGAGWQLRLHDGTIVQVTEAAEYWEKQEQQSQEQKPAALVQPNQPGRMLCGYGVYGGLINAAADSARTGQPEKMPLVSLLFAIDRRG